MSKYPKEVMNAAKVLHDWLESPDAVRHLMEFEEVFYNELRAAQKRTDDWLKSLSGLPAFVTTHGVEVMCAVTAELGQIESEEGQSDGPSHRVKHKGK